MNISNILNQKKVKSVVPPYFKNQSPPIVSYRYSIPIVHILFNIGIKHGFSCINIRQVPREVLKTEAGGRGFQHFPRDMANVNALLNHVRSLLLHKN